MSKNREQRQEAIREIIRNQDVRTQFALVDRLRKRGFSCTQATISRDITEMGLYKQGEGIYILREDMHLQRMASTLVTGASHADNLVVVRSMAGSAQAVAAALDGAALPGVLGTVAGDDTILAVCEDKDRAAEITELMLRLME